MTLKFYSHQYLAARMQIRPPQYAAELERFIAKRDADGIWIDETIPGYVELCQKYRNAGKQPPSPPQPGILQKVVNGAVGIAKAVTGTDRPSEEVIAHRSQICNGCPRRDTMPVLGVPICGVCNCIINAKIVIASQSCPLNYWPVAPEAKP